MPSPSSSSTSRTLLLSLSFSFPRALKTEQHFFHHVWPVTTRLSASLLISVPKHLSKSFSQLACVSHCHTVAKQCVTEIHFSWKKRTNPTHSPPTACPKTAPGLFKLSPFSNFPVPSSKNCTAKGLQPKTLQVDLTAPDSDCLTRNCFGIGAGAFRSFLRPGVAVPAHSCTTSYIRARSYAKRRIWADFPLFASQLLLFFQLTTDGEVLDTEFYFHSEFDWFRWIQWLGCDF